MTLSYRFTIKDRNNTRTVVDEPIGWDAFGLKIKRHAERHGTMREIQSNDFSFDGVAADIINTEYDNYGSNSNLVFIVDWKYNGYYKNLYTGKFYFKNYSKACGSECSTTISIEQIGALVDFIYRLNQKVDLDATTCFDGSTLLVDYADRKKTILLHTKGIVLQVKSSLAANATYDIDADSGFFAGFPLGTGLCQGSVNPVYDTTDISEIKNYNPDAALDYLNHSTMNEIVPAVLIPVSDGSLKCMGTSYTVEFHQKGRFKELSAGSGHCEVYLVLRKGNVSSTGFSNTPNNTTIWSQAVQLAASFPNTSAFDITHTEVITLLPGEKLWLTYFISYTKNTNFLANYSVELDAGCYFKAKTLSKCDDSTADGYLIHETLSRITESITNNVLKVKSSYYGRVDSLPYSFGTNGCGGLRSIHNGLNIRKAKLTDGSAPKLFVSMDDMLKGLVPIDNVGVGYENGVIRIEDWKYFYNNNVTLRCTGINNLKKQLYEAEHYSIFSVGYKKWEAEEYNGLDELLTKREFRTGIDGVQNTLEKLSSFIGSGYAIEVTRRRGVDSKDWRYDNDVFIICLVKIMGNYESENNNITTPLNIIDPATVFNYRLSPSRNAMRWFDRIMAAVKKLNAGTKLTFSAGDGNYLASGLLSTGPCIYESHALSESQNIALVDFADQSNALPINFAERIKYSYPVTNAEFDQMDLNGLVYYETSCEKGEGWIDEFVFKPDRESDFVLIPKRS